MEYAAALSMALDMSEEEYDKMKKYARLAVHERFHDLKFCENITFIMNDTCGI